MWIDDGAGCSSDTCCEKSASYSGTVSNSSTGTLAWSMGTSTPSSPSPQASSDVRSVDARVPWAVVIESHGSDAEP